MKKRLLACLLTAAMLVSLFPLPALAAEAERPEWMVTAFDPLDGDTAAQTVPQGGEPVLPDSLTAWAYVIEDDTAVIPPPEGLDQESEQPQTDGPDEAEDNQLSVDGQEGPEDEQLPSDSTGEPSTSDMTLVSRTAENTPEPAEKQEPDIQPVTIPSVTWEAQPEFDPDTPGEYVYTPVLPAAYEVAGEVELPVISVTVAAAEQTALQRVQAMIDALPAPEDITADNRDEVEAQLEAIGEAWAELSDTEALLLDTARLEAAQEALAALDGQAGNELPAPLTGETGNFTVTGGTSGTDYSYADNTLTILTDKDLTISGTTTTDKIVIQNGTTANVTIDNLKIDVSGANNACAFEVAESATCNLTLTGENVLKSGQAMAALRVPSNASLTIVSESDGSLDATGGKQSAGIGSNSKDTTKGTGSISIHSGTITATGGEGGAGIGGGWSCSGGTITINGGTVTITGGEGDGAGIGGGRDGAGGTIIINGGTVTASGQWSGAGIGGGGNGAGGKITINGGTVTAIGNSAGIGGGTYGAGGTFDTGTNGNAFIVANGGISDKTGQDNWSGIIFDGNAGYVGGSQTLWMTLEIKSNQTLTVANNSTLTVPEDKALINSGIITNYGTISGTLTNDGAILVGTNGSIPTGTSGGTIKRVTDQDMTYLDLDGQLKAISDLSPVTFLVQGMTMWNSGCYVAYGDITLDQRAVVSGTVQLVLLDGCSLNAKSGIDVGEPNSLTIYGQPSGTGQLTAKGGAGQAGIGGAYKKNSGVITINGGTITATGGAGWKDSYLYAAAGIGGGDSGAGGTITINGGIVTATGGYCGAGIGGGRYGAGGAITINGGFVTATGGESGAGIGGGYRDAGGAITISGGTVNATGGYGGAGIGNGEKGNGYTFEATGNAFIIASSISDQTGKDSSWSGVIFERNEGKVYGSPTLKTDATIPSGKKLEIPAGKALPIDNGVTLTNNEGEIINNGTLQINETGKLVNNGTITNNSTTQGIIGSGTIEGRGTLTGSGTLADTVKYQRQSSVTISFEGSDVTGGNSVPYGSTITIKATAAKAAANGLNRAVDNQMEFFVGTGGNKQSLGTAVVDGNGTASLQITLSGTDWGKGFQIDANTITAEYDGSEYLKDATQTATLTVTKKELTATISGTTSKTYDGTTNAPADLTIELTGKVSGDDVSATAQTITYDNANVGTGKTITASGITLTGAKAGNYTLKSDTATETVTPTITSKELTATIGGTTSKTYDGTTNAPADLTIELTGKVSGDDVSATAQTITYDSANVGTGKTITANGIALTGAKAGNYTLKSDTATETVTPTITPKELTATISGTATKTYDGNTTATGLSIDLTGIVSNDDVSATATSYTYDNANVGTGKTITASGITLTGAKAGNYTLKSNTATITTGSITQATISGALNITGTAAYGQTLTASYAPSNGETVSYQWNRGGAAISGATGSTYTLTADDVWQKITVTATPTDTTNYTGSVTSGATAAVAKATPTVKVEVALSGSTGAREAVLTVTVTGVTGGAAPTGTVTLTGDNSLNQTLKLDGSGKATYTWSGLAEGDHTVTAEYGGDSSYDTARANKTFNTNKQEQDTLAIGSVGNKTYGDSAFTLSTTGGSGNGAVTFTSSDPSVISISGTTTTATATIHKAGGPVTITATKAEDEHYNAATATLTVYVAKKAVVFKANDKTVQQGGTMPTFDYAPVTLAQGDSITTEPIAACTATDTNTTGTFPITLSGAVLSNGDSYDISYQPGTLTVTAKPSTGGGGGGWYNPPTTYSVTIPTTAHGKVVVSPTSASRGAIVTITAVPEDGYRLSSINVTSGGKDIALTEKGNGKYTFTMPAGAVKVTATFVPAETPETPWNNPFADVSEGDWYYEAVRFVQEQGLMNGYSDGRFGPNDNLSRAQLAQILFNKEGRPGVNYLLTFSDVAGEAWYTEAIRWATSQGIVSGYGNGTFGPNDPITREQLAVMLWRYSGSPAATNKELYFNDESEISGFALEALRWAVENGILNGYGDGRLGPQGQATRAQVAQMLKNFIENQEAIT